MVLDGLGDDVSAVDVVVGKLVAPEMLVVTNVEILVDYFVAVMLVEVQDGWDDGDVVAALAVDVLFVAIVDAPVAVQTEGQPGSVANGVANSLDSAITMLNERGDL